MENYIFINEAINDAFLLYLQEQEDSKTSFLSDVVKMLMIIYGNQILENFKQKEEDKFQYNILKYGYPKEEYNNFLTIISQYYMYVNGQKEKSIKKKNKYFNLVQKYLIDMLIYKNNIQMVSIKERKEFYNLLYTANSKDFWRASYALLMAYNSYEIDEYFKKQKLLIGD